MEISGSLRGRRRSMSDPCSPEERGSIPNTQDCRGVGVVFTSSRNTLRHRRGRSASTGMQGCRYSATTGGMAAGAAGQAVEAAASTPAGRPQGTTTASTVVATVEMKGSGDAGASKSTDDKKAKKISVYKRLLQESVFAESRYMGAGVLAMFVSSATNLAFPTLVGKVLDRTAGQKQGDGSGASLRVFVSRTLALFLAGAIASFVRTHSLRMAKEGTMRRLRKKLLKSLLRQEKAFFDGQGQQTGQHLSILDKDVESASEAFTTRLVDGLRSLSSALNGTAMLFSLSPKLTGVSLGLVPIFTAAIFLNVKLTKRLVAEQRDVEATATSFAHERLQSITTVRAFAAEERDLSAYEQLLDRSHALAAKVSAAKGIFMGGLFFGGSGIFTAVLYYGGTLAGSGELSVGSLTSFSIYTAMVGLGFSGLGSVVSDVFKAGVSAGKVFDLLDRQPAIRTQGGLVPSGPAKGAISVENLRFAYPSRPDLPVLSALSLQIKPGQVVALVGASGSGKSTFLALLQRLYEPQGGHLELDGVDIEQLDPTWLRGQIGVVEQEPALFSGTVGDAIRYGKPDASEFEVMQAAIEANAHEFIVSFPDGYKTYVGERGRVQLSGGQKQRIALARALIKKPSILILDEATSALDAESERQVQQAMEKAMKERTVIVIAHRLSTIERADKVIVLEDGKVVEVGSFRELSSNPATVFAALHASHPSSAQRPPRANATLTNGTY